MFPILLDIANLKVALIGGGDAALSRLKALDEAGATGLKIFADDFGKEFWEISDKRLVTRMPYDDEIKNFNVIMIVDIDDKRAAEIAKKARKFGVMVNVEDKKEYCDFYFPSLVRRGDLIITVSTCGKSPTLAHRVREIIGKIFHSGWAKRVDEVAYKRQQWRDIGLSMREIAQMSDKYIDEKGWLDYEELASTKKEA